MNKERIRNWLHFINDGIWRVTDDEVTPWRKRLYNTIKVISLSTTQFMNDRLPVRASALTYSTLFAIIPILALLFAIARAFGMGAMVEELLSSGMMSQQAEWIFSWVESYLQHAQSGVFIGVGIVMLLFTILLLIDNIERSFNAIWQVKHPRTMFRKITDYFSMILLLPVLTLLSTGITIFMSTYVKNLENFLLLAPVLKLLVRLIPYALTCGMMTGLFVFMPNTRVRLRHALLPGLLAGSAFQAWQYFYINSQIWVTSYNAIYGSFAAIPLFLIWAQVSWCICLFGAEMNYVSQNLESFNFGKETANISRRYHDFFCTIILSTLCKRFAEGGEPLSAEEISRMHRIPIRLTKKILYELTDIRLVYEAFGDEDDNTTRYVPGTDINRLSIGMLLARLESNGSEDFKVNLEQYSTSWEALIQARQKFLAQSDAIFLKDL